MPDPIKMPAPPLGVGQVEVKLGAKRYVLNVPDLAHPPECSCETCIDRAEVALFAATVRGTRPRLVFLSETEEEKA